MADYDYDSEVVENLIEPVDYKTSVPPEITMPVATLESMLCEQANLELAMHVQCAAFEHLRDSHRCHRIDMVVCFVCGCVVASALWWIIR